jgi:hypothetical protein
MRYVNLCYTAYLQETRYDSVRQTNHTSATQHRRHFRTLYILSNERPHQLVEQLVQPLPL